MNEHMLKECSEDADSFMIDVMYYMEEHNCTKEEAMAELSKPV
jgi:hypothetical protein